MILSCAVLMVYIVNDHIPFSGQQDLTLYPDEPHPLMGFWPGQAGKESQYFDVRTSVLYRSMDIWVDVVAHPSCGYQLGVRIPPGSWRYRFVALQSESGKDDKMLKASQISLLDAKQVEGKYTFVLAPMSQSGNTDDVECKVEVKSVRISLHREPFSWGMAQRVVSRVWETIRSR